MDAGISVDYAGKLAQTYQSPTSRASATAQRRAGWLPIPMLVRDDQSLFLLFVHELFRAGVISQCLFTAS
jgi:hypothetical protein